MGRLEREAGPALQRLLDTSGPFTPDDRFIISNLLAFQFTRGRAMRSEIKHLVDEFFKVHFTDLTPAGIRKELKRCGVDPTDRLVEDSRRFLDDVRQGSLWVEPQRAELVQASRRSEHEVLEREQFGAVPRFRGRLPTPRHVGLRRDDGSPSLGVAWHPLGRHQLQTRTATIRQIVIDGPDGYVTGWYETETCGGSGAALGIRRPRGAPPSRAAGVAYGGGGSFVGSACCRHPQK